MTSMRHLPTMRTSVVSVDYRLHSKACVIGTSGAFIGPLTE